MNAQPPESIHVHARGGGGGGEGMEFSTEKKGGDAILLYPAQQSVQIMPLLRPVSWGSPEESPPPIRFLALQKVTLLPPLPALQTPQP